MHNWLLEEMNFYLKYFNTEINCDTAYGADQTSKQDNTIMSAWCLYLSLYQRDDWWIAEFGVASYQLL